jgi:hypothetical protein
MIIYGIYDQLLFIYYAFSIPFYSYFFSKLMFRRWGLQLLWAYCNEDTIGLSFLFDSLYPTFLRLYAVKDYSAILMLHSILQLLFHLWWYGLQGFFMGKKL